MVGNSIEIKYNDLDVLQKDYIDDIRCRIENESKDDVEPFSISKTLENYPDLNLVKSTDFVKAEIIHRIECLRYMCQMRYIEAWYEDFRIDEVVENKNLDYNLGLYDFVAEYFERYTDPKNKDVILATRVTDTLIHLNRACSLLTPQTQQSSES